MSVTGVSDNVWYLKRVVPKNGQHRPYWVVFLRFERHSKDIVAFNNVKEKFSGMSWQLEIYLDQKQESRAKPTPSWIPVTLTLGQTANVKTFVQQETEQLISKQGLNNSCLAVTV